MFVFIWNPSWETGVPGIDMQHKRLNLQLETLAAALSEDREKAELEPVLAPGSEIS